MIRPLYEIAAEISRIWRPLYYGAAPYVQAMGSLRTIDDNYVADTGREVVDRFLANAQSWRGPDARRIKAELKALLQGKVPGSDPRICPHCGMLIAIRNPSGYCDHLYYPEYCETCKKIRDNKVEGK